MSCDQVLQDRLSVINDPVVSLHADLAPTPAAASLARLLVTSALSDGAGRMLSDDIADRANLVATELVTNAVLHARTRLRLGICHDGRALLITVADGAPADRVINLVDPVGSSIELGESGRGMAIVARLADDFGLRHRTRPAGKIVWAVIDFGARPHRSPQELRSLVGGATGAGC